MKNFIIGLLMLGMVACANMPSISVNDGEGNAFGISADTVIFLNEQGIEVTCKKKEDIWGCFYKDANGVEVMLDNIDVGFLEEKNEPSK